jgi:hypothetical protein
VAHNAWGWVERISWAVVASGPLVSVLSTALFGPAPYSSFRLRRISANVNAMDPERHKAQREVLLFRMDVLASKVAAAHRIRTPWRRYLGAAALWFALMDIGTNEVRRIVHGPSAGDPGSWVVNGPILIVLAIGGLEAWVLTRSLWEIRWERARFIRDGCPAHFAIRPDSWTLYRRAQRRSHLGPRIAQRRRQLRRSGNMPDFWISRSRTVRAWIPIRAAFYRRWYPWLYEDNDNAGRTSTSA